MAVPVFCASILEGHTFNVCGCLKLADANHLQCETFYYDGFKNAVIQACIDFLPGAVQKDKQAFNQVAGWNDYVADLHKAARDAFSEWHRVRVTNRTLEYYNMCRTKRAFKVALRRCKRDRNRIISGKLANSLLIKNGKKFWKEIDKFNNIDNVALSANVIDGIEKQANIASLWRVKYSKVYNKGYVDEHDRLAIHE